MTPAFDGAKIDRTPARPGPGPTPPSALRALDLTVRRRVESLFVGEFHSSRQGPGTELVQVRPYQPGDDVRRMDWNVTARTRLPHVRVYVAERAVETWLALDISPSMTFGTAIRRKADVAEGVALAIGHVATRRGNRLGLLTFGGRELRVLPPRQGRLGLLGLLNALSQDPEPDGGGPTFLGRALTHLGHVARNRAVIVIVSDFRGPRDWRGPLLSLASRHDVLAIEIRDQREQELPNIGELWLVDPETGRQLRVDTGRRQLRERFAATAISERRDLASEFRKAGVDHLVTSTSDDWLRAISSFLRLRRKRR